MALKLCQCNICYDFTSKHPDTGQMVPGLLLKRHGWAEHQSAFKIWKRSNEWPPEVHEDVVDERNKNMGDFEDVVMATTLSSAPDLDPVLVSRFKDLEGNAIDPAPVGQPTQLPEGVAALSIGSSIPLTRPPASTVGQTLDSLSAQFRTACREFCMPTFQFDITPNSSAEPCPTLPYNKNKSFLKHQTWLSNLLLRIDGLPTGSDSALRQQRKELILEIQSHESVMDSALAHAWEAYKSSALGKAGRRLQMVETC